MQADFAPVKMLLSQLNTKDVSRAEAQLVGLCNSQQGLEYLYFLLTEDNMMVKAQPLIVSLINRLIVSQSMHISEEFVEEYLIRFLMDGRIVRKHKLAIQRSLSYCITKHKNFHITVLEISKSIITNLSKAISQNNIYESDIKQWITSQVLTFISLGHCILSIDVGQMVEYEQEDGQQSRKGFLQQEQYQLLLEIPTVRFITEFLVELQSLHVCLYQLRNITDFIDVFKELFELLLVPVEEGFNHKIMRIVYYSLSNWVYLPQLLMSVYLQHIASEDRYRYSISANKRRMLQSLKYEASLFHTSIAEIVLQSDVEKAISIFIDPFAALISQTALQLYNPMVQTDGNKLCQNFIFLLQDYYNHCKQTSIEQMMHVFQSLIVPLLDRILVSLRGRYFITEPSVLYEKLEEMKYYELLVGNILNSLVEIVKRFMSLDDGFSVFLFQLLRRAFQINYQVYGSDHWECPSYITDNDAVSLKAYNIFFIMSMVDFSNQIILPFSEYFRSILSLTLIQKMDQYSCGIMYFFLQNYYINIYDSNIKQGLFLFYSIFDGNINSSTQLFANKFIYNMSDSIVDIDFIITYVQKISILRDQMKWQIVQKWMNFYKDYSRKTNIRLAMGLIQSTRNKMSDGGDCQQLRQYLSILIIIADNLIFKEGIRQLVEPIIELCSLLVDRFSLQSTKKVVFHLLKTMLGILPQGQMQMFRVISLILQDNIHGSSQNSNNLYLLIAASLLKFTNKDYLLAIYKYCYTFTQKIKQIPTVNQSNYRKAMDIDHANEIYQQISNTLFILQGYQARHNKLDDQFTLSIFLKAKTLRQYLLQQIRQQYRNQLYHLLCSRCIVIEIYYCIMGQDSFIDYDQLQRQTLHKNFKDYDAMILLQSLMLNYPKITKQDQQRTIYMIRNILLTMIQWQKIMDTHSIRRKLLRKFFLVPSKTSSFNTQSKKPLQSIKRWMNFLQIKDWKQLSSKLSDMPCSMSSLIEEIGLMYKTLCSRQIKKQRCNQQKHGLRDRKETSYKRKRPNHFDAEQSKVERASSSNQQMRKIRKIILEQPQQNPTPDLSSPHCDKETDKEQMTSIYKPNSFDIAFDQITPHLLNDQQHSYPQVYDQCSSKVDGYSVCHNLDDRLALLYIENTLEKGKNSQH